ncbi:MAG TPA: histidine phosphatase family protein [Candidatus Acidoferrales bacterium]|nr:histidine phosphatase family protein [Candidatus Acidoferrales bacterium]
MDGHKSALTVLLIRHAESVPPGTSGLDEYTRPLTARGMRDAERLAESIASTRLDAVYTSPYLRARQTIEPLASRTGIEVATIDDLRERMLSPVELPDWQNELKRSWQDFDYAPHGGETSRDAQARVMRVLDDVAGAHAAGIVALASHGNLIALALHAIMPGVDYSFWESLPMPAVFRLRRAGIAWRVESGAQPS